MALARYELMIPTVGNSGEDLSHLYPAVKRTLAKFGIGAGTAHTTLGTWTDPSTAKEYPDEPMLRYHVDVEDKPEHDDLFHRLAESIGHHGQQEAVYHTKQPIETAVVPPRYHSDLDLDAS